MKKLIYAIALLFFVSINAEAQTEIAVTKIKETTDTLENSLLWKITGNDLEEVSYLYGTIHMIAKDDFFVTENTEKAIAETERMTFEINMEDMNNMGMMMSMMMNAFMKDGGSLKKLLTEEEYGLVKAKFDEIGLPIALFDRVKPMFTSMMTSMDMSGGGNPMDGNGDIVSYEVEFMEKAKTQKMEMEGLETVEYQMSMFDSIPYEAQAQMLVESVKEGDAAAAQTDQMAQMVNLYKTQNLNGLSELIASEEGGMGDYNDILLVNRNKNWIPVMGEQMKDKATFFAVGAGHLGGEEGVIRLLRNAGYTVTAMP